MGVIFVFTDDQLEQLLDSAFEGRNITELPEKQYQLLGVAQGLGMVPEAKKNESDTAQ